MQRGHRPFSYVAISFSAKHYLMCSRFCLVWTLLLCIWKTDGFAWLYVCVSLNLVTCVFYLIDNRPLCFSSIHKNNISMLLHLIDFMKCRGKFKIWSMFLSFLYVNTTVFYLKKLFLVLSMYVHLILIYKVYEYVHA